MHENKVIAIEMILSRDFKDIADACKSMEDMLLWSPWLTIDQRCDSPVSAFPKKNFLDLILRGKGKEERKPGCRNEFLTLTQEMGCV